MYQFALALLFVIKYKNVRHLDSEKGINKPFENVFMSGAYSEIFQRVGTKFRDFFMRSIFRQNSKQIVDQKRLKASPGHAALLPRKIYKNLHTSNGHFTAF